MAKYIGMVISDIHVGAMDLEKLHNEYLEMFIKKIYSMDKLDFLIIDGDTFDHKFYLNDKEATVAYVMLKELVLACKEKGAVIRIVYGTESHECDQYNILSLLKIYDKIEVVKYAKEEELLEDLHILYLPEEHLLDKNKYYEKFFNNENKYDYIFGHGIVREVMKDVVVHIQNTESTSTNKRKKVPIFTSAELKRITKGQVYFGHYHMNQEIDNKIFSVGSFSRWKFGEEGRKGYYILKCDTEKNKYKQEFIENTMADGYKTISFGYDNKVFESEDNMNESLASIEKLIERDVYDNVRFVFNIPSDVENPESTMNYLKERFKYNNNIKVEIVHGYIEEKRKQQKEQVKTDNEKYSFIFDKNLEIEDKISRFITLEYDKNIPTDNISNYIYKSLNEILVE